MRKVLLTVMMVSSLLAFNACKKDGVQGPAGPAGANGATGATGAAGPAGAVGAAGAKGADGTKILSGTADPAAADGVVGDYFFNKTTKTLWGPKVAAGWAGTNTTLTGPAGSKFLAGSGAPSATAPTNAVEGDYYFDTATSTFYGPKAADGTWAGTVVLSSGAAAKNSTFTKGFETIVETVGARSTAQKTEATYSDYTLFTTFKILSQDIIRTTQYPGWKTNREMVFESAPGSGIFNQNLTSFAQLGTAPFILNSQFKYVNDASGATFNFSQVDIDRLSTTGATSFSYWNFAAILDATLNADVTFAKKKNVKIVNDPTKFATTYTAVTKFDLNTLPGITSIEDVKTNGKLFAKYKYFNAKTATAGNTLVNAVPMNNNAGWSDITTWANSYVGATGNTNGTTNLTAGVNPFSGALNTAPVQDFMATGTYFGNGGAASFAPNNNIATGTMDLATAGVTNRGKFSVDWTITSGNVLAAVAHAVNDTYYNAGASNLTVTTLAGTTSTTNTATYNDSNGGLEPAALSAIKLVQVNVLAIPAANVAAAKAKGVNVDDANAMSKFIKL
jgi:hypothetical protein